MGFYELVSERYPNIEQIDTNLFRIKYNKSHFICHPIHIAIIQHDIDLAFQILENDNESKNEIGYYIKYGNYSSTLQLAVRENLYDITRYLILNGASLYGNRKYVPHECDWRTTITFALKHNNYDMLDLLFDNYFIEAWEIYWAIIDIIIIYYKAGKVIDYTFIDYLFTKRKYIINPIIFGRPFYSIDETLAICMTKIINNHPTNIKEYDNYEINAIKNIFCDYNLKISSQHYFNKILKDEKYKNLPNEIFDTIINHIENISFNEALKESNPEVRNKFNDILFNKGIEICKNTYYKDKVKNFILQKVVYAPNSTYIKRLISNF
jgi:hypothetical protein